MRTVSGRVVVISWGGFVELYETDDDGLEIWLDTLPAGKMPRTPALRAAVLAHELAVAAAKAVRS